jgi:hypothetical protein
LPRLHRGNAVVEVRQRAIYHARDAAGAVAYIGLVPGAAAHQEEMSWLNPAPPGVVQVPLSSRYVSRMVPRGGLTAFSVDHIVPVPESNACLATPNVVSALPTFWYDIYLTLRTTRLVVCASTPPTLIEKLAIRRSLVELVQESGVRVDHANEWMPKVLSLLDHFHLDHWDWKQCWAEVRK